jgi:hypothetical protein
MNSRGPTHRVVVRHLSKWCSVIAAIVVPVIASPLPVPAQGLPSSLAQFLQQSIGLSPSQMNDVSAGKPVVTVLDPPDRNEVAVFGIVAVGVPRSFYVQRATRFPSSLRDSWRKQLGMFSDPATVADVAGFTLPHDDVKALAHCSPGSCSVKVSVGAMSTLRVALAHSKSPDSVATAYFRRRIIAYVDGYRAHGDSALIVYDDRKDSTAANGVFTEILSHSPYMYQYVPTLERYLQHYPADRPAGVRDAIFWANEDFPRLKHTLTIVHAVVYSPPELPGRTFIVQKLLYSDHYMDGGLDFDAVVDRPGTAAGVWLVSLRRLHFDHLPGGIFNLRGKVIGQFRDRLSQWLGQTRAASEQAYAKAGKPTDHSPG